MQNNKETKKQDQARQRMKQKNNSADQEKQILMKNKTNYDRTN